MKILIILSLLITLSACSVMDKAFKSNNSKAVVIEDKERGGVAAIVGEQASFEWKESSDPFSKLEVMPAEDRKKAVEILKVSGIIFWL